ncbi:MAG TPA: PKD domain-containing protein [Verrucomicrobiota bacterium]|nr:PKD domain-containing protein [Verrucomicrobiota bacterium]
MTKKSYLILTAVSCLAVSSSANAQCSGTVSITNLPTLGGSFVEADAINLWGDITGVAATAGDASQNAFVYDGTSMTDLGTLGGTFAQGLSINSVRHVAGRSSTAAGQTNAFYFDGTTMINLGTLCGTYSEAVAVNHSGVVAGNSTTEGDASTEAFMYAHGVLTRLGSLGSGFSTAVALSQTGSIAGYSFTASGELHAFLYELGTMQDLGTLGGGYSLPFDLADPDIVVGESATSGGFIHGFLWTKGSMQDVGTLGGTFSTLLSVNSRGQAVGISTLPGDLKWHGIVYSDGSLTGIGTLGGDLSELFYINDLGQAVGYSTTADGESRAILWQQGQMLDLNTLLPTDSGWVLEYASFVSESGRVVGFGMFNGSPEVFIMDLASANEPPVANAGVDVTVECPEPVILDGTGSTDPEGSALSYLWTANGTTLGTNAVISAVFGLGVHTVTLTVTDACGATSEDTVQVSVVDTTPPVISAPEVIHLPSGDGCQALVPDLLATISATDNCTAADQLVKVQNPPAGTALGAGEHIVQITVTDESGNEATAEVVLNIQDSNAPAIISANASPAALWPPNHKLVAVDVSVLAQDNCDETPVSRIVSITSNYPVEQGDIQVTGPLTAKLAASKGPSAADRIYTITVESTDKSGNTSTVQIAVPVSNSPEPSPAKDLPPRGKGAK